MGWFARHPRLTGWVALLVGLWFVGTVLGEEDHDPVVVDEAGSSSRLVEDDDQAEALDDEPTAEPEADETEPAKRVEREPKPTAEPTQTPEPRSGPPTWAVAYVVDGDTVKLTNGESVRLVGIDTPERGECGFDESKVALERLIRGRRVQLRMSDEDRDGYGRLLRYVDVAGMDTGLRLIRAGLAVARYDSRDGYGYHPREPRYIAADEASKDLCPPRVQAPKPVPLVQSPPKADGGGACAPGYDPCIPPYPPDVNCDDVNGPLRVSGDDPHGLDRDGDGIACES